MTLPPEMAELRERVEYENGFGHQVVGVEAATIIDLLDGYEALGKEVERLEAWLRQIEVASRSLPDGSALARKLAQAQRDGEAAIRQAESDVEVMAERLRDNITLREQAEAALRKSEERAAELEKALTECAGELEDELKARYGSPPHPAEQRRYDRDMATVIRARATLTKDTADQ